MKQLKLILGMMVIGLLLSTTSCKDEKKEDAKTNTEQAFNQEMDSAYVCPMHCEGSGSEEEGTCPKCGMAYVKNEDHKKDGHTHE